MRDMGRILLGLIFSLCGPLRAETPSSLRLAQEIPLRNVKGRIDHMAADLQGKRLFVAALGNDTVEVVDLRAGKQVHAIRGPAEPQGVLFLADSNEVYVAGGKTGECWILNGRSFQIIDKIKFSGDADNIRYASATHRIYVGYGSGAIGVIDAVSRKRIGAVELPGHPESFQIDENRHRIFVNVPSAKQIAVLDSNALKVEAVWPLQGVEENFPMALDAANERLFVAARKPPRLLVFDTRSGGLGQEMGIDGDADDIFYDGPRKRLYISCGAGFLDVVLQRDVSDYSLLEKIPTAGRARTSLFVPEWGVLYLAAPAQRGSDAALYVYEIGP